MKLILCILQSTISTTTTTTTNSDDYWHERVAYSTVGLDLNQKLPTRKIKPPANQMMCNFSMDKALPMPAPFGSVLLWQPNCKFKN